MNSRCRNMIALAFPIVATACGGGGGDNSSAAVKSTLAFPVAQAVANFVATSHHIDFKVSGSIRGSSATGSGSLSYELPVATTFEGQPALEQTVTDSGIVTENGNSKPYAASARAYYTTNYQQIGADVSGASYCVAQNKLTYPASAKVGDTGTLGRSDCYQDNTKALKIGSTVHTYVIEADSSISVLVNQITNSYSLANVLETGGQLRLRIDEFGNVSFKSLTLTDYTTSPETVLVFSAN